jgi:hypothetical protein
VPRIYREAPVLGEGIWVGLDVHARSVVGRAAQRTSRDPCLVIFPRCTVVSDSWWPGGQPGPAGQLLGPVEPGDVADLGDQHGGEDGADAFDGQQAAVARVMLEPTVELDLDRAYFIGEDHQDPTLRR